MRHIVIFTIFITVLLGCVKKPNYSRTPQISFKSFKQISQDSAILTINFSDGDGDIGGAASGEGNFFITYYFWNDQNNKYDLYVDNTFFQDTIDVRTFPSPSDAYKNKPISGEIALLMSPFTASPDIKKFKYTCYIKDNAGNKSNLIQTPDLYAK